MKGIFITGTDTGIGKTFITAHLASVLQRRHIDVGVMKPIHTGCKIRKGRLILEDTILLIRSAGVDDPIELVTPYAFREPVAPYVAALKNNVDIDIGKILRSFETLCRRHDYILVEGIGGPLVPISERLYVVDLIKRFKLPALIVTRPGLGTINHTLLTVDCLKRKKIPIVGIIINYRNRGRNTIAERSAPRILEKLSGVSILGTIPWNSRKTTADLHPFLELSHRLFDIPG